MKELLILRLKIGFYFTLPFLLVTLFITSLSILALATVWWLVSLEWVFVKYLVFVGVGTLALICPMTFFVGFFVKTKGKDVAKLQEDLKAIKEMTKIVTFGLIKL